MLTKLGLHLRFPKKTRGKPTIRERGGNKIKFNELRTHVLKSALNLFSLKIESSLKLEEKKAENKTKTKFFGSFEATKKLSDQSRPLQTSAPK